MAKFFTLLFLLISVMGFGQITEEELIRRCQEQYYKDYVSKYFLPNFGRDSSRIKLKYQAEEILKGGFKIHRFFRIRMHLPHSFSSTYCIRNNDGVILNETDVQALKDLLNDSQSTLTLLDKSLVIFIAGYSRPLKSVICNENSLPKDTLIFRKEIYEGFIGSNDENGKAFIKHYSIKVNKNKVTFFVYSLNLANGMHSFYRYSLHYANGQLTKVAIQPKG